VKEAKKKETKKARKKKEKGTDTNRDEYDVSCRSSLCSGTIAISMELKWTAYYTTA